MRFSFSHNILKITLIFILEMLQKTNMHAEDDARRLFDELFIFLLFDTLNTVNSICRSDSNETRRPTEHFFLSLCLHITQRHESHSSHQWWFFNFSLQLRFLIRSPSTRQSLVHVLALHYIMAKATHIEFLSDHVAKLNTSVVWILNAIKAQDSLIFQ